MEGERPFDASQRKLERARRAGRVLRAATLPKSISGLVVGGVLVFASKSALVESKILLEWAFAAGLQDPLSLLGPFLRRGLGVIGATLGCAALLGCLCEVSQVGVSVQPGLLAFKLERINPFAGVVGMVRGLKGVWENALRLALLGGALSWVLCASVQAVDGAWSVAGVTSLRVHELLGPLLLLGLAVASVPLVITDLLVQRRKYLKDLSMSHQEVRDEQKESEGDPLMRSARRQLHEAFSFEQLAAKVRRSSVVIVERNERAER